MRTTENRFSRLPMDAILATVLLAAGCSEPQTTVKPTPKPYVKAEAPAYETPTVENTAERSQEIQKVCSRKAQSSEISSCWMAESERNGAKKFDAEIRIMMYVNPEGRVQDATILNPGQRKQLEACVLEATKGWSYPSGQTVTPAQCNFYLRPIM